MYAIEVLEEASAQLLEAPAEARHAFVALWDLLELHPWSGDSASREKPDANMRIHSFGERGEGMALYLILEDQRRVAVLQITWFG